MTANEMNTITLAGEEMELVISSGCITQCELGLTQKLPLILKK